MTTELLRKCEQVSVAVFGTEGPSRLPSDVAIYLAHVEGGAAMRAIASAKGQHPSTIMRAVRRVETMRDDPLLDRAIDEIEGRVTAEVRFQPNSEEHSLTMRDSMPSMTRADKAALRKLSEPEAFLLVANGAEKAGVFCRKNQFRRPLDLVAMDRATYYLRQDWVRCASRTDKTAKYQMT